MAASCGTYSNHLTARPTKPGAVDLGVHIDVVATERGTMNRGIYDLAVLFNPASPWTALQPQPQLLHCIPRHQLQTQHLVQHQ